VRKQKGNEFIWVQHDLKMKEIGVHLKKEVDKFEKCASNKLVEWK